MAIPAWTAGGVLPVGLECGVHEDLPIYRGHDSDLNEVRDRFVVSFSESETRARLYSELEQIIEEIKRYVPRFNICISGSFVLEDGEPEDINITVDLLASDMVNLDGHSLWMLDRLCNDRAYDIGADSILNISVNIIRQYEAGHAKYDLYSAERLLQFYMSSYVDSSRSPNGYVEVFITAGEEVQHEVGTAP